MALHIPGESNVVTLSNEAKSFNRPKWSMWAQDGFIHIVDEDTGGYCVRNRHEAKRRMELIMLPFGENERDALDNANNEAHAASIKEAFRFRREFEKLLKRAEQTEHDLMKRYEKNLNRRNARVVVPADIKGKR